ncbi:MAG: hypothetical protein BZY75_02265 [SAR202 cluster bacterium Io17-Chloro-G7]|nr:MAG: hypothetical protein BZY75_02265 [SAR202 cluster bacterium Io17-Chloro-G7]
MTTLAQKFQDKSVLSTRSMLWLAAIATLVTLLVLLTKAVADNPEASQDIGVKDWITGWDLPGLYSLFSSVSAVTHTQVGMGYGALAVIFLLLLGKTRPAIVFAAVGVSIAVVALGADHNLGVIVGRGRPLDPTHNAFPSGHTYGTTVFFSFLGFLAFYYRLKPKILILMLVTFAAIIVSVGLGRIYIQAHFPSDVAGGYLMAGISLLIIIPVFVWLRSSGWPTTRRLKEDSAVVACDSCMVASSIASVVV